MMNMLHSLNSWRTKVCMTFITALFLGLILVNAGWAETYQSDVVPWSGYWWPSRTGGLGTGLDYRSHPSPIEKYELLTTGYAGGSLLSWYLYESNYYVPNDEAWVGLCAYWASSSLMEPYDILPSTENNIVFRVGDKKGLLVLCHDHDLWKVSNGGDPVEFHFWLLDYIKDQKKAFMADLDAGPEVWYYPIYRYDMTSRKIGTTESVTVTIYYADDAVFPDIMGTREKNETYAYSLFLNDSGEITGGEWSGQSIQNHPDTLVFPLEAHAKSPYIDCDKVRQIARAKDDDLERDGNAEVTIGPGTYNLVLLNEDRYGISGFSTGDEVSVKVKKQDGSNEDMHVDITDGSGDPVFTGTLEAYQSTSYSFTSENPPYFISMTQADYSDPNIYTLSLDIRTAYQQRVPFMPKNGEWSGFTLTNAADTSVDKVALVTYGEDGRPLQTVYGPIHLTPKERHVFVFENLNFWKQEFPDIDSVVLKSSQPMDMVNLFAYKNSKPMAGFVQGKAMGTHLVIPDVYKSTVNHYMKGKIFNESFSDAPVLLSVYAADGQWEYDVNETIPANGTFPILPGVTPFTSIPDGGWIEVVSKDSIPLSGYQYLQDMTGNKNALETLFALPVDTPAKYVLHVTDPVGNWKTSLTLVNPTDKVNPINIHAALSGNDRTEDLNLQFDPYEKRTLDLTAEFGRLPGDDQYHSILQISGQYSVVGYYTFIPRYGNDVASIPLVDASAFQSDLVMPHSASSERWWTGVQIDNPNDYPVQVVMEPYDESGRIMDSSAAPLTLKAGGYAAFAVRSIFPDLDSSKIGFIQFHSKEPYGAPIGGFYLFGRKNDEKTHDEWTIKQLSGANM